MTHQIIQCTCGAAHARVEAAPRLRFRCHCTRCQSVYNGPFADALVFRRGQVSALDPEELDWIRTLSPSPLVRGVCKSCRAPVLAHFYYVFSIIPARALPPELVPDVHHDVYYKTRTADLDDGVPKHGSALGSYLGLTLPFTSVLALPARPLP